MKPALVLLLCFMSFFSFAKKKINPKSISGNYTLVKQKSHNRLVIVKFSGSEIMIDTQQDKIRCYVGCNSISGAFHVKRNQIEPLQLISTEKACPDIENRLEGAFLKNMSSINHYKISKNLLYLMDEKEILIVLKRKQ